MAKMYAFNEAERAAYLGVKKITHGKGKQIHLRKKWERKGSSSSGGSASAGWGKVVAHGDSTGITAADWVSDPKTVGWGYINPCSCPNLPDDIDAEPDPEDLTISVDAETFQVVYNMVPEEILPGETTDIFIQWKTLQPGKHRFVDVQSCVEVAE